MSRDPRIKFCRSVCHVGGPALKSVIDAVFGNYRTEFVTPVFCSLGLPAYWGKFLNRVTLYAKFTFRCCKNITRSKVNFKWRSKVTENIQSLCGKGGHARLFMIMEGTAESSRKAICLPDLDAEFIFGRSLFIVKQLKELKVGTLQ